MREGRIDLLVDDCLIIELKAVESIASMHTAQVSSCLRASGCCLGLLINFVCRLLRRGTRRVVLSRPHHPYSLGALGLVVGSPPPSLFK